MAACNKYFGKNATIQVILLHFSQWETCAMCLVLEKFQKLEEEVGFSSGAVIAGRFLSLKYLFNFFLNYPFAKGIGPVHGYRWWLRASHYLLNNSEYVL